MATITKKVNKKGTVWRIDYYDPRGKRVRKDLPLRKEAEAYLGKVLAAKKEGRYYDVFNIKKETRITFDELAGKYVENYQAQKGFSRMKQYVVAELRETFGKHYLSEITYLDLETYRNRRRSTPTWAGKPRADATVNREVATLRHMLNKAVEWGMLENNPFSKGSKLGLKENNHRLRFLTEEEVGALLKACSDLSTYSPHLRPLVETALNTGMRRGELLSLKWEQIRNGFIYLTKTKTNKARQIPINDRLAQVFQEVRRGNQMKSEFVFCNANGGRLYTVNRSFPSACRRAGIEDFHFHDLRHTFASHLVMNGVSLKAVQELLGHTSLAMTMRYAHLSQAHLQEAVAVWNSMGNRHQMDTKPSENQSVTIPLVVNLPKFLTNYGGGERI
jgi:integrase